MGRNLEGHGHDLTENSVRVFVWRDKKSVGIHNLQTEMQGFFFLKAIGTGATPGLLCQPRVIVKMIVEKQMDCRLAGETEVLRENLPQHHFCPSQNPTSPDRGLNPGRLGQKLATNCLSCGVALRCRSSHITTQSAVCPAE
jgi:hypothetical protein